MRAAKRLEKQKRVDEEASLSSAVDGKGLKGGMMSGINKKISGALPTPGRRAVAAREEIRKKRSEEKAKKAAAESSSGTTS